MDDNEIQTPACLSAPQISRIRALAGICQARDGYSMEARLDFGTLEAPPAGSPGHALWYADDLLAGFAGMYSYSDPLEVETCILVHPEFRRKGIGRALVHVVIRECRKRSVQRLLLIVPQESQEGAAFAHTLGALHFRSEYTMDLDVTGIPMTGMMPDPVELRPAGIADVPVMAAIAASAFAGPVREEERSLVRLLKETSRRTYLATQDGKPVGVIQSVESDGRAFIVHFAVRPDLQGRGIGQQMLLAMIHGLRNSGSRWITIEVETGNQHALSLYRRCGFVTVSATDYELLELHRIPTAPELLFDS